MPGQVLKRWASPCIYFHEEDSCFEGFPVYDRDRTMQYLLVFFIIDYSNLNSKLHYLANALDRKFNLFSAKKSCASKSLRSSRVVFSVNERQCRFRREVRHHLWKDKLTEPGVFWLERTTPEVYLALWSHRLRHRRSLH